jgi:hypothetical protein
MNVLAKALPDVFAIVAESTGFNKNAEIRVWWTCAFFQDGSLIMITMSPPDDRSRSLLKRFALVFGMAYRRFADLKKAEAQPEKHRSKQRWKELDQDQWLCIIVTICKK